MAAILNIPDNGLLDTSRPCLPTYMDSRCYNLLMYQFSCFCVQLEDKYRQSNIFTVAILNFHENGLYDDRRPCLSTEMDFACFILLKFHISCFCVKLEGKYHRLTIFTAAILNFPENGLHDSRRPCLSTEMDSACFNFYVYQISCFCTKVHNTPFIPP